MRKIALSVPVAATCLTGSDRHCGNCRSISARTTSVEMSSWLSCIRTRRGYGRPPSILRSGGREMILGMEHPTAPGATATDTLLLHRDGPVATLTINRPDRLNAVTFAMFSRLPALLAEAEADGGVRVLVLRGAGRKSFSAGADISEFATARTTPQQAAVYDNAVLAAEEALATFPAPTIAAIHGHCYGGGCALALACGLRFASSGARVAVTP